MTQSHSVQGGPQNQAWTLEALDELPQAKLDDLFKSALEAPPARPAGPMPEGDALGIAIAGNAPFWRRWIASFARRHLWQGKVVSRTDDDHATLVNKILDVGIREIHATVYRGPSRFDGKECIVIDYSKTSFLAKKIRDEIREVSPGVYLGIVYWGDSTSRLINFALSLPTQKTI